MTQRLMTGRCSARNRRTYAAMGRAPPWKYLAYLRVKSNIKYKKIYKNRRAYAGMGRAPPWKYRAYLHVPKKIMIFMN
jgi:hypothetical protein